MSLLQMSISGGVLILAVTVIRALTLNQLPKRAFFLLWLVAALRLLMPVSIPSPVSVYSLAEPGIVENIEPPVTERFSQSVRVPMGVDITAPAVPIEPAEQPVVQPTAAVSVEIPIWQIVWAAGSLVCAAFFIVSYMRCRRRFRESLPVEKEEAAAWLSERRTRRTVEIRQSDTVTAPLTYGVIRPVILLPKALDWGAEMAYVLEHELVHIQWFDAAWKLVLAAAACVHWWNPLAWVMYVLANRDIELSCDEAVVRRFGLGKKSAYAMALISMEETKSGLPPLVSSFSRNAIEERITAIMKIKKTSAIAVLLAAVVVCGVLAGFATSAAEGPGEPEEPVSAEGMEETEPEKPVPVESMEETEPEAGTVSESYDIYTTLAAAGPEKMREYLLNLVKKPYNGKLVEGYTEEKIEQILSTLWFDGYKEMTIADYRQKMLSESGSPEAKDLIDRFSLEMWLFNGNDNENIARRFFDDYLSDVYEPLTAEKWQTRGFSQSVNCYDTKVNENNEIISNDFRAHQYYHYTLSILDADTLLVGEYEQIHQAVKKTASSLFYGLGGDLWDKNTTQVRTDEELAVLGEQLSTEKVQVSVTKFVFVPARASRTSTNSRAQRS